MEQPNSQPLRYLTQSQGWREFLMPRLIQQMMLHDKNMRNPKLPAPVRDDASGRSNQILETIAWVYKQAGEPNPLDVYHAGLWSDLVPHQEIAAGNGNPPPPTPKAPRRAYRPGGSVT